MRTELLAPAGSLETLKAVIRAGADAVYIGGERFGARAYADNPDEDTLIEGLHYAHLRGKKVYLTVNTLLKETELAELYDYILPYYRHGLDAVLVQDFGVLRYLHRKFPDLELHASTQMTVTGDRASEDLKKYGVTRVVPARELNVEELRNIKRKTGMEVEVFIHGALCVCYSGVCLYSGMIGGRSGNRGRCAQPCRLLYLKDDTSHFHPKKQSILDRPEARHFLSPKDLNGINAIPELVASGMDSLKIEGRMKRPEYAAGVVSIYRKYLDLALAGKGRKADADDQQKLYDLYNRTGFTDGYLHRHNGPEMMAPVKHELTIDETNARHALYEEMHEAYINKELRIPVTMLVSVYAGSDISLFLKSGSFSAFVSGPTAEFAQNRPMTGQQIEERMSKLGDSDFYAEEIQVETDGVSFVPVRALNDLRRKGIEALKQTILEDFLREVPSELGLSSSETERTSSKTGNQSQVKAKGIALTALVSNHSQFEAALGAKEISEIYVEGDLLYRQSRSVKDEALYYLERCKREGKNCSIALPYVYRKRHKEDELLMLGKELYSSGLTSFLVRSYESLAELTNQGLTDLIRADAGIYTYNSEAEAFLSDHGIQKNTAPLELNRRELAQRDNIDSEVILYGRVPLMVTAQCLEKNDKGCTENNGTHYLTDRMGVRFPTRCVCTYCYNIIYNSVPIALMNEVEELKRLGFSSYRLQFTDEDSKTTKEIIQVAASAMEHGANIPLPDGSYTKGHFLRGVE